ncbi:hypothetical protein NONO_c60600 [Nocardia nova SH22a]|uniref:Uncharacterized protein n=1 Tax=Nocardia nova SH22a TaxID=1415166 RepID=W5TUG2_9NOCA|nr:hypothetical protein [Nocardia nova]AHH20836.1 hypothetical protein NONO_c60600 [Nocardia nova SH22a]
MIPVVRLVPGDQWDQNMLDLLLADALYPHGLQFEAAEVWPDARGIVLVVPGRYWADRTDELTAALARYEWVLAIRTSDEEALFEIAKVEHPNIRWWVQTPRDRRDYAATRYLPLGFPSHFNKLPPGKPKQVDVFLSGQNTHDRRAQCFAALDRVDRDKIVNETAGFTQGMPRYDYAGRMIAARVAPCPSGAVSPESFRVYEALEAHTMPIADDVSPVYSSHGYWTALFPDVPFPTITNYASLPGYIDDVLADYPRIANRITAWWIGQKRRLGEWLIRDLEALGAAPEPHRSPITVLVSSSPIPSHPSTELIEETIESIRERLPDSEIILMLDGIRPEQDHRRAAYEAYIQAVLELADHQWRNVLPLISDEHQHQGGCTARALEHVRTPLILYVEHDTPLTGGIPFDDLADVVLAGDANVIRFHHETRILDEHRYLMLDQETQLVRGVPMQRTIQWSQRPHLASLAWYRGFLARCFPAGERDFIEDRAYGLLVNDHGRDGDMGWRGWRTWIYTPEGNVQRSYHTDGRDGERKYG